MIKWYYFLLNNGYEEVISIFSGVCFLSIFCLILGPLISLNLLSINEAIFWAFCPTVLAPFLIVALNYHFKKRIQKKEEKDFILNLKDNLQVLSSSLQTQNYSLTQLENENQQNLTFLREIKQQYNYNDKLRLEGMISQFSLLRPQHQKIIKTDTLKENYQKLKKRDIFQNEELQYLEKIFSTSYNDIILQLNQKLIELENLKEVLVSNLSNQQKINEFSNLIKNIGVLFETNNKTIIYQAREELNNLIRDTESLLSRINYIFN